MSCYFPYPSVADNTVPANYVLRMKRKIFDKFKRHAGGYDKRNLDHNGNEYYILNGIACYHLVNEGKYSFGKFARSHGYQERAYYQNGYYIMSTRPGNYAIIDDPDVLHFILHFDLSAKHPRFKSKQLSLHKELAKRLGVDYSDKKELTDTDQ